MIIFLYGQDSHRLKQEADSIVEKYKKKHSSGVNLSAFDLEHDSVGEVWDSVRTLSFFDEVKLVVIRNAFFNTKTSDSLLNVIKDNDLADNKAVVLLIRENLSGKDLKIKNDKLFALLTAQKSLSRNFEVMDASKLETWIKREFQKRNCSISGILAKKLISLAGSDTNRLTGEVNKLSNFKLEGEIDSSDIDSLVSRDIETNIFNLLDALTAKNKVRALELLYIELNTSRDPHYLLTMMIYQLRNLLMVKDLANRNLNPQIIAQKTKIHPFIIKKLNTNIGYTQTEAKRRFDYLAQVDQLVKNGKADLEDCLYSFVIN